MKLNAAAGFFYEVLNMIMKQKLMVKRENL